VSIPRLLTVAEVAEAIRVSTTWVYDAVRSGEIPAVKIGRRVMVVEQDLALYLDAHRVRVPEPDNDFIDVDAIRREVLGADHKGECMDPDEMMAEAVRQVEEEDARKRSGKT
jgi:excisionase family DNA binding protein